jgi:hypothetical protein
LAQPAASACCTDDDWKEVVSGLGSSAEQYLATSALPSPPVWYSAL